MRQDTTQIPQGDKPDEGRGRSGQGGEKGRRGEETTATDRKGQSHKNKKQSRGAEEGTDNKQRRGGREGRKEQVGGYTLDTSLIKGVGALKNWFEPRAVKSLRVMKASLPTVSCMDVFT